MYFFAKNREPLFLNDDEQKALIEALKDNASSIVFRGQIYNLLGVSTTNSLSEAEMMWGQFKGFFRCSFNQWHSKGSKCDCYQGTALRDYKSPLEEFQFYQDIKVKLIADSEKKECPYEVITRKDGYKYARLKRK